MRKCEVRGQTTVRPSTFEKRIFRNEERRISQVGPCGLSVKSFTGDSENKSILDQMREQDLLGKTLCSVKAVRCKGFNRYILC